jgi:hypothetical protein
LAVALALQLEDATDLAGDEGHRVEWESRSSAMRMVGSTFADLRFMSPNGAGATDEIRYEMNVAETALVPTYGGPRMFNVQVLCSSDSQEPDADSVGLMGGRLRTRMRRPNVLALLQDAGVALVSIGPTFDVSYSNQEGRDFSASSTEVRFACVESDTDATDDAGWIAALEAEGTLESDFEGNDIVVDVVEGTIV